MLQKTTLFSPLSINQPMTSNQIKSSSVVDHQCEGCSKEASVNENLNQFPEEMFFQEGDSPEKAGFRFSMSRLPEWARCKVINNSLPVGTDSSLCKVGLGQDYACLESQSPSNDILEVGQQFSGTLSRHLSETDSSQASPSPPETCSPTSNNRWLTIHTVCMDLLDSPGTCDVKGFNIRGSATDDISEDQFMEATHYSKRIKLSSWDSSTNNPPVEPNFGHSDPVNLQDETLEECIDVDASGKDSQESEIFKTNFGNLSTQLKMDRDKTSSMDSYMCRFLLRRELLDGRKRSLCMHTQDSTGASPRKNKMTSSSLFPMKSSSLVEDGGHDSIEVPDSIIDTKMPLNVKVVNVEDQKAFNGVEEVEIVRSCEEALHYLEAAAENALQSFCKLATVNIREEKLRGVDIQLYAEAVKRLPSIEKKILAIAKLLHPTSNFQREKQDECLG